jgi:hypothetical protein
MPFFHRLAVVRSKTGIIFRTYAGEIAESFEIRTALEVALIERKDEPETLPLGTDKAPPAQQNPGTKSVHAGQTVYVRSAAEDGTLFRTHRPACS